MAVRERERHAARDEVRAIRAPWWARTLHVGIVGVLGVVALVQHADPRLVAAIGVPLSIALGWSGRWPKITFGDDPPAVTNFEDRHA